MGAIEDDAKKLAEYARAGAPPQRVPDETYTRLAAESRAMLAAEQTSKPVRLVPRHTATVTPIPPAPTLQDEILKGLDALVADIRTGKVSPSHLIIGYGVETEDKSAYTWDCIGLNRYELIGHLTTYAATLAVCEDE